MQKNRKFFIGGIVIGLALVFLAVMGFQGGSGYYFTVAEALAEKDSLSQSSMRIQGEVAPGYTTSGVGHNLFFTLLHVDETSGESPGFPSMEVSFTGTVPNNFESGRHVVVEGSFNADGSFQATRVITACASKYEPAVD